DIARVVSADPSGIKVEASDGTLHELKAGDPMMERISLAYALNMHAAQGITTDTAIGTFCSDSAPERVAVTTMSVSSPSLGGVCADEAAAAPVSGRGAARSAAAKAACGASSAKPPAD
ncbi:hypothetical protein PCJ53_29020, partial [Klebsiella pneumoniae]|nr:hypothetical protein [Klebsiella pneumoniae]